ncbi:MAG TPA: adenylate/guanylate cyclase domain-containing protein, partial [Acidimicrobiia bacterium]|nr:adenylate/guanylate cyclase domain-containing protein [Acidimicrobiia bacterium]
MRSEDALGERRQLTVLFCDIVGSTELSRVLDPEDLAELVGEYQKICGEAVRAHEGHIAQYLGDGVVVYFGYPRSHEDEAQRAVRCGLEILDAIQVLRDSGRFPPETSLDVRLGAHTGRGVVGPVGGGDRKDRLALGATPNIAARIQADAEPGTLTVSDATWKIVEGYFIGKRLGESKLKGISEPIELWLVTGVSESNERVEVATMLTPFVGRQQELAVLQEAWRESRSGATRVVQVRGEPGVGKSRLAQLFRDEIQFEAADMLAIRATPYTTNTPFQPVIEMIQRRFGQEPTLPATARLERLEAGLRRLGLHSSDAVAILVSLLILPADERHSRLELSPARQRSRTLELLVDIVGAIAAAGPTLLLVEDLHWMDTSTLDFLELLVTIAPPVPLLGVVTVRPEVNLEWGAEPTFRTIDLARFERSEAEAIVRGVTIGKALPAEILRQIIVRSDGIPLFVEELTHSVLDSGMLSETEAGWETAGPISADIIPATMDASLTSRIDRLGASRATAQLAATIGREFSFELLREVSERDEAVVRWDVERLMQAGLAWSVDEGKAFVFKHALVRDAAYNSLLRSTRQSYHRRIAATLREQFAEHILTRPDLIAYHLTNAGEDEEAIAYWEAAGEQALARAAVHEAAEHLTRAIECVGRVPSSREHQQRELELQIRLAPLLMTVYGWGAVEVERACERALA